MSPMDEKNKAQAALLKKAHEAGIPRKEHCDGLVFDVVRMLE